MQLSRYSKKNLQMADCTKLVETGSDPPIEIDYRRLVGPADMEYPYFLVSMKSPVNDWTLISTKLSERYNPILVDKILDKCPYKINIDESSVDVSLSHISALVALQKKSITFKGTTLKPAYFILNSYNGSSSTNIYVCCRNSDTNYIMPIFNKKIVIKHNIKAQAETLFKVDTSGILEKCKEFVKKLKLSKTKDYQHELYAMSSMSSGKTLYESYVDQIQHYQEKQITPQVLLEKVKTLEDLLVHIIQ